MKSARYLIAVLILLGAALAACSGNFGSGTTPPNGLLPSGNLAGINPTPTPTPNSASNIVTYGSSTAFQPLPTVAGYGGAIAFTVPSPKPSGFTDIAVGATLSVIRPSDTPDLNLTGGKGKKSKKRERPARALAYITLLPTHDVTLDAYPRIAVDIPRDVMSVYHENEFGLALYNAASKEGTFRLAVAAIDNASPPPTASPNPSAPLPPTAIPVSASPSPSPTPTATGSARPSPSPLPSGVTPSPGASVTASAPTASPTLPPQRITFTAAATPLKLIANRPVVFAVYALPVATPAPTPRSSNAIIEAPAETAPEATGSPLPKGSPEATGSPAATGTATPAPVKV